MIDPIPAAPVDGIISALVRKGNTGFGQSAPGGSLGACDLSVTSSHFLFANAGIA